MNKGHRLCNKPTSKNLYVIVISDDGGKSWKFMRNITGEMVVRTYVTSKDAWAEKERIEEIMKTDPSGMSRVKVVRYHP